MMSKNKKSVVSTYRTNTLILIILSGLAVASLISIYSISKFSKDSKALEEKTLASQKETIEREVLRVQELIEFSRSKLDTKIRKDIKERVYEAHKIATGLYKRYKNTKTRAELESIIIEALRPSRFFNGRGYNYAITLDGVSRLSPITPDFEGKSLLEFKTKEGDYFIKKLINIVKQKEEGFYDHEWSKPDRDGLFDKVSFVKMFEPFNWLIGTGDYVVDVEERIKKNILEQIGKIRFGKEGYIFVVNFDGVVMMNMGNPSIIGKNIIDVKDENGIRVAHEIIQLAKDPKWDGYFKYSWKKFSTKVAAPKIAYQKVVPEWRWYYGTGVYTDDVDREIEAQKEELKRELFIQIFIIVATIFIAIGMIFVLSKKRAKELDSELARLLIFFEKMSNDSDPIDTDRFTYNEFSRIAYTANHMLETQKKAEEKQRGYEEQILQSQKMNTVNQLIGGISHDFNNILAVILGFGEQLEMKLKQDNNEKLAGYAHQINTAGLRGANITKKLLSLTKHKHVERESCDVNNLLFAEKDLLEKSLTAKIELKLMLQETIWPVLVNKSDFEDVILNLCINAMHAMYEGQQNSRIIITTNHVVIKDEDIKFYDLKAGDYIRVVVSDNGKGMDAKTKERIFDPFFTTRDAGHGLGLSQVYSFTKNNNGTVIVDSIVGKGTTFEILIPRFITDINIEKKDKEYDTCGVKGNETILVVEDESALRELSSSILKQEGYKVFEAGNGVEALAILEKEKVDLVLSDVIMPIMDGNVLAEKIRMLYPHIKIQLISGFMEFEEIPVATKDLYKTILNKPVTSKELLDCISGLLRRERNS